MRKFLLVSATALLLPFAAMAQNTLSGPVAASNSAKSTSNMSKMSAQDSMFVKKAAMAGMAEVSDGQLAETKGDSAVKAIGTRMVADHTKANDQLKALAQSKGCMVPSSVSSSQAEMTSDLQGMSGTSGFDAAYLKGQKMAHDQTIALFQKEASDGTDPDLKTFASNTLPTLRVHLKMIETAMK